MRMFVFKKINKISNIKHGLFSRNGGLSKGIYRSLNCGINSKDKKDTILKNRKIALKKLGLEKKKLIIPHQTHSNIVKIVDENMINKKILADGIITKSNKVSLGILTADCAPIFFIDIKKEIICAIHAGWKGAKNNIIKNGVKLMLEYGSKLNNIISCIGPCIGKDSYLVKVDFFKQFMSENKINKKFFIKVKKSEFMKFNLISYIKFKTKETGVKNIFYKNFDTYKDKKNFFSYRRSKDKKELDYGRCVSIISLI